MKVPGWWRVSYFYDRRVEELIEFKKSIERIKKEYIVELSELSDELVELSEIWRAKNKKLLKGVNVIGFAKGDFSLSQSMRLINYTIATTDVAFCLNNSGDAGGHSETNEELVPYLIKDSPYLINLFTYNSDHTITYCKDAYAEVVEAAFFKRQYNISYGYWELSEYPEAWKAQDQYLNEIWAASTFIKEVVEKYSSLPVFYMPLAVEFKMPVGYTKPQFGLPEGSLMYLFTFDLASFPTRKNPQAVIEAFSKAFPVDKNEKVSLVIKVHRIPTNKELTVKAEALKNHIAFDSRIHIIDELLDRNSILGLISVCDCYVSLHRAEGFGLGMAEAMKMGKVVIGTNYSGNTDYMNEENSCLVNYTLIPVAKKEYVYVEDGAVWAEPDAEHASSYMRKIYEDKEFVKKKGEAAKLYIDTHHSFEAVGKIYQKRLKEILYNKK